MSAIKPVEDNQVDGEVSKLFSATKASMGKVPNMFRVLANAPAAFKAYVAYESLLSGGVLTKQAREQLAIAIAAANGCDYCLAAHTGGARAAGVNGADRASAQEGHASDRKTQAILELALAVNATHGRGSARSIEAARASGLTDAEILETIASVAINILTNSINNLVGTTLDFPKVDHIGVHAA